jgi:hypothetical protein
MMLASACHFLSSSNEVQLAVHPDFLAAFFEPGSIEHDLLKQDRKKAQRN